MKILLEERLCDEAMERLEAAEAEVVVDAALSGVEESDAVILSGEARVPNVLYSEEARVRVVGRLGVANGNFDQSRATRAGIMVLSPRHGEAASVADCAMYLLLAMARNRKEENAIELKDKTLGFLGFPPLAGEIAQRAKGFGMRLLCYDPDLNRGRAMLHHCEESSFVDLFVRSDFLMVLAPRAAWNEGLVGKDEIQLLQKGAGLIALTDPQIFRWEELVRALDWGYLDYFAIDLPADRADLAAEVAPYGMVTVNEAANTQEARVGNQIEMADDVVAALHGEQVDTVVNIARVHLGVRKEGGHWCRLAHTLGLFMGQRLEKLPEALVIDEDGSLVAGESHPIVAHILAGLAEGLGITKINQVNSRLWANEEHLELVINQDAEADRPLLRLKVELPDKHLAIAATRESDEDIIVQVDDYELRVHPHEHMLLVPHINRPGLIGQVGTLLGEKDVNIAEMMLGYKPQDRTTAIMWLQIEQPVDRSIREESRKLASVLSMEYIYLPNCK